jgi:hypothetical protein
MNKESDIEQHAIHATLAIIALALGLIFFSGCTTQKSVTKWLDTKPKDKTEAVVGRYLTLNELFAATFCDEEYPVQESTETKTDTLKVPVIVKGDSIPCPPVTDVKTGKTYTPMVKCPDVSYYQTTITTLEKTTKESTAKADRYRLERDIAKVETLDEKKGRLAEKERADKAENQNRKHWWGWGILGFGIMGFVALKVFKPF